MVDLGIQDNPVGEEVGQVLSRCLVVDSVTSFTQWAEEVQAGSWVGPSFTSW